MSPVDQVRPNVTRADSCHQGDNSPSHTDFVTSKSGAVAAAKRKQQHSKELPAQPQVKAVLTWSPADISSPLDQRAERIRSLVTTARTCLLEIGRELIAAKEDIPHGEWTNWLSTQFGWSEQTARRYMQVAEAFKTLTVSDLAGINLSASAQYVLASPTVPPEVRTEAVQRAEAGETITKKAAEEMVRKAEARKAKEIEALMGKAIDEERAKRARATEEELAEGCLREQTASEVALEKENHRLASEKGALGAAIKKIKSQAERPDISAIANTVCLALGTKKLSDAQYQLLSQMMGKSFAIGHKHYQPVSAETLRENEARLKIGSVATESLQAIASLPAPVVLLETCRPIHRRLIRDRIGAVAVWVADCQVALAQYNVDEEI